MNTPQLDWAKMNNLIPAIVQDHQTMQVLMLGYMNQEALAQTLATGKVVFYSRSKKRLWEKGETSGNFLRLIKVVPDCDNDSILILADPDGPTCHLGTTSCFNDEETISIGFLVTLARIVADRHKDKPTDSYTAKLFAAGIKRIAQKVGEEGVEVALAAAVNDRQEVVSEAADLIFHLLILLKACDVELAQVLNELRTRCK